MAIPIILASDEPRKNRKSQRKEYGFRRSSHIFDNSLRPLANILANNHQWFNIGSSIFKHIVTLNVKEMTNVRRVGKLISINTFQVDVV